MHSKDSKTAARVARLVALGTLLCCGPYAAANDLADRCEALAFSASLGLKAEGKTKRKLTDPNKMVVHADEVLDNFLNDSAKVEEAVNPYFSEKVIARQDSSSRRTIKTGGSYVTSAKEVTTDGGKACIINAVVFPADREDPAVEDKAYRVPNINLQLVVPLNWADKQKLIHFGGGGFNGTVVSPANYQHANFISGGVMPLSQGYALVNSDSGHRGGAFDTSFVQIPVTGQNVTDQKAVRNYSGEHIKRVRDVSRAIIYRLTALTPKRTYFIGFSTGGREALKAISKWGKEFDGAVAGAPAWDVLAGASSGTGCEDADYEHDTLAKAYSSFLNKKDDEYRKAQLCQLVSATSQPAISLDPFVKHGGKLIIFQGEADKLVPPTKTQRYWEALSKANPSNIDFARYYEIPKFNHGYGKVPHWNLIDALDTWVEEGLSPEEQKLKYQLTLPTSLPVAFGALSYGLDLWLPYPAPPEIEPENWKNPN